VKFTELEIPGLILVEPDVWGDPRGFFLETFHAKKYADGGIKKPFIQDNHSHSARGVLRGLHYQRNHPQGKLVCAVRGEIFDVAVDVRRGSPAFGKWVGRVLSDQNHAQLYVPEGCVHGFLALSDEADVWYKCTELYVPSDDQGIIWNDPTFRIDWPMPNPLLSDKDARLPRFSELPADRLPTYSD
jgi:dTDP-4-dehydrorhamnose 3,5-epimerase